MDCLTCNGNGEIVCYKCGGNGVSNTSLQLSGETQTDNCDNCSSTGYVVCHHCFGNGNIE